MAGMIDKIKVQYQDRKLLLPFVNIAVTSIEIIVDNIHGFTLRLKASMVRKT